ncbi:MAG: addiction module protein [Gammaproteobacteria bacterium]|nr:addiction module protein [Gammaproteobacteria bacterium]
MSVQFKQLIENIRELSPGERALLAHCLISSLESEQDEGVDETWIALSEKRSLELESGDVKGVSWEDIKNGVKGQDAQAYISPRHCA